MAKSIPCLNRPNISPPVATARCRKLRRPSPTTAAPRSRAPRSSGPWWRYRSKCCDRAAPSTDRRGLWWPSCDPRTRPESQRSSPHGPDLESIAAFFSCLCGGTLGVPLVQPRQSPDTFAPAVCQRGRARILLKVEGFQARDQRRFEGRRATRTLPRPASDALRNDGLSSAPAVTHSMT
jgi:hypothetical protein